MSSELSRRQPRTGPRGARAMVKRRPFGSIRKLPSGRWQARVLDAMGGLVPLGTYVTKSAADQAISRAAADQSKASWVDPRRGQLTFENYAEQWMTNRVELRPLTRELYQGLLDRHILPRLGHVELGK